MTRPREDASGRAALAAVGGAQRSRVREMTRKVRQRSASRVSGRGALPAMSASDLSVALSSLPLTLSRVQSSTARHHAQSLPPYRTACSISTATLTRPPPPRRPLWPRLVSPTRRRCACCSDAHLHLFLSHSPRPAPPPAPSCRSPRRPPRTPRSSLNSSQQLTGQHSHTASNGARAAHNPPTSSTRSTSPASSRRLPRASARTLRLRSSRLPSSTTRSRTRTSQSRTSKTALGPSSRG